MTPEANIKQFTISLGWFREKMSNKLSLNSHKGNWRDQSIADLVSLMEQEVYELKDALSDPSVSVDDIIDEAVDISNFCMFIADTANSNREAHVAFRQYEALKARAENGEFKQFMREEEAFSDDDGTS